MIIDKKHLKEFSPIPLNYNLDDIMPMVNVTESIWVRPLLGFDMYEELCDQVKHNNVSPENATLLTEGGLWQMLGVAICYENLPQIVYHLTEVGVTKHKTDTSESVELKELTYYANHLRAQLESLKKFTINWLAEHAESFPSWLPDWEGCNCSPPASYCCSNEATMNNPEPFRFLYTTKKKDVNIN